jgi:hypothetical protein
LAEPDGFPTKRRLRDRLVALTEPGDAVAFKQVNAGSKLAIRYASMSVGTISVSVNGATPGKHAITVINRGPGPVALDALIVWPINRGPRMEVSSSQR